MYRRFVNLLLVISLIAFTFLQPAFAQSASASVESPDPVAGAKIFNANCSACHMGGNNVIIADKTLKQAALEKYLANYAAGPKEAIMTQVKNGKNAMPAFNGRLSDDQIADVASYVLNQAQKGW